MGETAEGCLTDSSTIEGQFLRYGYPAPGNSPIKMYYKYGGSDIGTMNDSNRYVRAFRSDNLEFLVNRSRDYGRWNSPEFCRGGMSVRIVDMDENILDKCMNQIKENLALFQDYNLLKENPSAVLSRITAFLSRDQDKALGVCEMVVEAIPELMDLKKT